MEDTPIDPTYVASRRTRDISHPNIISSRLWLRLSKLDEVPQLVNILMGDMQFFGNRPFTKEILESMSIGDQNRYKRYKPGLIGQYLFADRKGYNGDYMKMARAYLRLRSIKEKKGILATSQLHVSCLMKSVSGVLNGLLSHYGKGT